jgi:hypothetical protein
MRHSLSGLLVSPEVETRLREMIAILSPWLRHRFVPVIDEASEMLRSLSQEK